MVRMSEQYTFLSNHTRTLFWEVGSKLISENYIFSRTLDLPASQIFLNFTDSKGYRVHQNPETKLYTHVSYVSDVQVMINNEKIGTAFEVFNRHISHLAISFMDRISHQCHN